jgi:hypothetical protein
MHALLIVMLILSVIAIWPKWPQQFAPWRLFAFALSWLAFSLFTAFTHGPISAWNLWLILQVGFAIVAAWPRWVVVYAPYRLVAFAISWAAFAAFLVFATGGIPVH